jgi:MFS family permease
VSFVGNLPTFVLGVLGGAIADRMSRRAIMIASLLFLAAGACLLAALTATGHITVGWVLVTAAVGGTATALYTPAMHASIPQLVPEKDLLNAISLNSVQFNLARAVGPAVAGVLYGAVGPAWCFAINSIGFLVLAGVLASIRLPPRPATTPPPIWRALREGVRYVRTHPVIGPHILLAAVMSLFGFPYIILLPALASDTLHLGARGLGLLMAAVGSGAVVGGLFASFGQSLPRALLTAAGSIGFGLAVMSFPFMRTPPAVAALLFTLGALQTVTIASLTTTLQVEVTEALRGRVMSMLTVIFFGFSTLGGLCLGFLGDRVGVPGALAVGGVVTTLVATTLGVAARRTARAA